MESRRLVLVQLCIVALAILTLYILFHVFSVNFLNDFLRKLPLHDELVFLSKHGFSSQLSGDKVQHVFLLPENASGD